MKRFIVTVSIIAILVTGAVFHTTTNAYAAATACSPRGCDLFQYGPYNGYFFSAPGLTPVKMICWTDAQWYAGTNRWFKVNDIYGTGTNWISANQVINQTTVGHC